MILDEVKRLPREVMFLEENTYSVVVKLSDIESLLTEMKCENCKGKSYCLLKDLIKEETHPTSRWHNINFFCSEFEKEKK